ncbi:MAG TPA: adenylate/guanylate cyclase domain-containing protein [Actinomycetota bacterium]|nr:adenylate/guanylate cyclase domain-containing protein [Actinomycetota bacterium]
MARQGQVQGAELPTGTVTFLLTDIEGSTALLQRLGERYPPLLSDHHRILLDSVVTHGGVRVKTEGDAIFAVFTSAVDAVRSAVAAQRALADHPWPADAAIRVRMGLHTGEGRLSDDDYVGLDVHRAARISSAGHGGQIVISEATRTLAEQGLPDGVRLLDLGGHRLKDLSSPERLFQVCIDGLPHAFPALKTLDARPNNLPAQLSSFVGREGELARVRELLTGGSRLVTLTGPGGTGKTRLSLEVAGQVLDDFPDGVFFVPLAAVTDGALVPSAIAAEMGLRSSDDRPLADVLVEHLRGRRILLVLDNLEQIPDASDVVSQLLTGAPDLRVLVTTREVLRVAGEQEFPVPPLSVPTRTGGPVTADDIRDHEAVRLFVERARQSRPDYALSDQDAEAVADICARLEGLPLAIELASARLRLFSPEDLRDRLRSQLDLLRGGVRSLPARQQTLRSTIAWSYDLLDPDERAVFCVTSLFSPARVDTVQAVLDRLDGLAHVDALDVLSSLADKSLLRADPSSDDHRLSMLESIREYARERLEEEPGFRDDAARAHAEYFHRFAQARHDQLFGRDRERPLHELGSELDNLLSSWRFWIAQRELGRLDELLNVLWVLHEARGWYRAAAVLTEDVLEVLATTPSSPERERQEVTLRTSLARALMAIRGVDEGVEQTYERAMELIEAEPVETRFPVLRNIASFHVYRAQFEEAVEVGRQLLELAEESGDPGLEVDALTVYGANTAFLGDVDAGLAILDRAIALFLRERPGGRPFRLGPSPGVVPFTTSAFLLWLTGHPERAVDRAAGALQLALELEHPYSLAYARFHVALLDLWRGALEPALEGANGVLEVAQEHEYDVWRAVGGVLRGVVEAVGGLPGGIRRVDEGMALYQDLDTPPIFWPVLLSMRGVALAASGQIEEAIGLAREALAMSEGDRMTEIQFGLFLGELLIAAGDAEEADATLRRAVEIAGPAGLRMLELQGWTRLAQLHRGTPAGDEAASELGRVLASFTEGHDTAELVQAREAVEQVASGGHASPPG